MAAENHRTVYLPDRDRELGIMLPVIIIVVLAVVGSIVFQVGRSIIRDPTPTSRRSRVCVAELGSVREERYCTW